jgi:DNA polymerase-3 subunit epsilon
MPPRLPIAEHNLFFFDAETGGLDAATSDMVEVACIRTDPTGKNVLGEYVTKVFPERPVDPKAAAINGYNPEKWATEAIRLYDAMPRLHLLSRNTLFVSHNVAFDWQFYANGLKVWNGARWPGDYHKVCTVNLAMPLLLAGKVENLKLGTLAAHFGVKHEDAHSALGDVRACRGVYLALMEYYAPLFRCVDPRQMASPN